MRISKLKMTQQANEDLASIEDKPGLAKQVKKTLGLLQTNMRHPSLKTHKYSSMVGPSGEIVFEAYAQNKTPGAYRVFWCYGPGKDTITILAITPHP